MGIHAGMQHRDREQKKFCGNKTSVGYLTTHLLQGSVGPHIMRSGQYIPHRPIVGIYYSVTVPKMTESG